jgi:two-component sensor histidine kinase
LIRIEWQRDLVDGKEMVSLRWQEVDGPAVHLPDNEGFGTTLIQRSIRYELQGEAQLDYAQTGLICVMSFPLPTPSA